MKMNPVLHLGELHGTVLLFGGPYSNLAATQALQQEALRLGIPPERIICTGDVVAYCAEPAETLALINDWGIHVVQGNCEQSLGSGAPDCGCGFDAGSSCSLLAVEWYRYASQRIAPDQQHWMARLPGRVDFKLQSLSFSVVHGSPERINEFVFPGTDQALKQAQLNTTGSDVVIGGHCGIPFGQSLAQGHWLNAGVIGMPAHDGSADGWYMLLIPDDEGATVQWQRLSYDAGLSQARMQAVNLCSEYADALTTGFWPSDAILPDADTLTAGQRLALPSQHISLIRQS